MLRVESDLVRQYEAEKRAARHALWRVALISVPASLLLLAIPLYLFQVYSRVLTSRSIETLVAITFIVVFLLIVFGFLDAIRQMMLTRIALRLEARVSGLLLAGELSQPMTSSSTSQHYLGEIRRIISSSIFPSLFDLPVMVFFLLFVFLIHPVLGMIVLAGAAMLLTMTALSEILTGSKTAQTEEAAARARRILDSHLRQHELIRALGLYMQAVQHWGERQATYLTSLEQLMARSSILTAASKTMRQLLQIAMIGGGAVLVLSDEVTAGVIFASSIVASRALAPIEVIVGGWRQIKQAQTCLRKLDERVKQFHLNDQQTPLPRPTGRLTVDRVVYMPRPGAQMILKGINGAIESGQTVAIIGASGAGKSTLARILVGYLEPSGGQVLLDGQPMSSWDPVARGQYMGYLPQQVSFFDGTIRENIARMRISDPAELAIEAARFAGIHDMIMRFPEGYDTMISEVGFQPSGGQKQLIGLARAFYGRPAFVILDEPNASLDVEGEKILADTLKRAKESGIATIVVTQRQSLLQHVDKVLILKNGAVEAYGAPSEVLPGKILRAAMPGKAS